MLKEVSRKVCQRAKACQKPIDQRSVQNFESRVMGFCWSCRSLHAGVFSFVFALQKCSNLYCVFFPQDLHFSPNSVDLDSRALFCFTHTLELVWVKVFARYWSTTFSKRRYCIEFTYAVIFCKLYGKSFSLLVVECPSLYSCSQRKYHAAMQPWNFFLNNMIRRNPEWFVLGPKILQQVQKGGFRFKFLLKDLQVKVPGRAVSWSWFGVT